MKTTLLILFGLVALFLLYAAGHKIYSWTLEKPAYHVVEHTKDYEIRRYEPFVVAQVEMDGEGMEAMNGSFMKVGGYIFGDNEGAEKIAMTAPVLNAEGQSSSTLSFAMPSEWTLDKLPVPNDADVQLREIPEQFFAVKRVFGTWRDEKFQSVAEDLMSQLDEDGFAHSEEFTTAFYDPPSAPFFVRRNEVLVQLTDYEYEDAEEESETLEEELAAIPEDAAVATFAGGCFWCIETAYDNQPGVYAAIAGYAGGDEADANYKKVATGGTEHRESVQVHYNPEEVSYEELLEIFWRQIDPTDDGGQFADRGFQYTTAIYSHDEAQATAAAQSKEELTSSGKFEEPIVTELLDFSSFFPAEEEHQNFAQKRREYYQRYKTGSGRAKFIDNNWKQ